MLFRTASLAKVASSSHLQHYMTFQSSSCGHSFISRLVSAPRLSAPKHRDCLHQSTMLHTEMFVVFCSAFAGVVAWALLSQLRRTSRYDLQRIPGPRTVPLVGNLGAVIGSSYVHKVSICSTQRVPFVQLLRKVQNLTDTVARHHRPLALRKWATMSS